MCGDVCSVLTTNIKIRSSHNSTNIGLIEEYNYMWESRELHIWSFGKKSNS